MMSAARSSSHPLDPHLLNDLRQELNTTITVCLPAKNEEATVGQIVASVRRNLMEKTGLIGEVLVMDDNSTDGTAEAAQWEGAKVFRVSEVLPALPPGTGKGNALWLSLAVTEGDIICWIDADVRNFQPHFVTGLIEPLLRDSAVQLVKGYYRRPLHGEPNGGGRVTELLARPVISALFPELTGIIQPLSGEYAGRRSQLEAIPFVESWGVELGLLIDIAQQSGVDAIAQADLGVREHRNRNLDELGPQAMEVLVTALRRTGLDPERIGTQLARFTADYDPSFVTLETGERPPMNTVKAYQEIRSRSARK